MKFFFWLIVAALALTFVGCGTVSSSHQEKSTPSAAPPAGAGTNESPIEKALLQAIGTPPAEFEGEGWIPLFNDKNLDGWKPTAFSGRGPVEVTNSCLVLNMGDPFTGVNWTREFPTMNYEIALDAARLGGSDFFCGLTLPVGDSYCSLIVGGWGGSLLGISSIDSMDASENETAKYLSFDDGRFYRIRLRVTPNRLEGWLDKEKVIDLDTTDRRISLRAGEIEMSKPMGLASWQTIAAFRAIKYRTVDGPADTHNRKRK